MSAILNGLVNCTLGLICEKLRDYTADKLNEGDLNDEVCRQIIVREIEDIKTKLDGISRKDLLASLSFFKEGVNRLYMSLDTSGKSAQHERTLAKDKCDVDGAKATKIKLVPGDGAERDALKAAFELSEAMGSLLIASEKRYKLANESLKEAKRLATEAFNNAALSTEERMMASKLRIASRILEGLDDPDAAAHDCLLYLKELQSLTAVQAMFFVWLDAGKGIRSRLRAGVYKKKRNGIVNSIQMMNELLYDLVARFTNIKMGLFNWPMIENGREFYHPLLDDLELKAKLDETQALAPWYSKFDKVFRSTRALSSKGEILSKAIDNNTNGVIVTRRSGEEDLICEISSENEDGTKNVMVSFSVDENDNVHFLLEIRSRFLNDSCRYKLLTLDLNGKVKGEKFLQLIDTKLFHIHMRVTKNGMFVLVYCEYQETMYICDTTNIRQDSKFLLPFKNARPDGFNDQCSFTVSNKNEIIFAFWKNGVDKIFLYMLTMDGKVKRSLQLEATLNRGDWTHFTLIFNYVNETILVSLLKGNRFQKVYSIAIFILSTVGELLNRFDIPGGHTHLFPKRDLILISHPNGPIALVKDDKVIMLQM
ncbi:uncharacterized protein LOC124444127 [Xenia sp. Carnegie-2017]|uniref:uncharacterized protein LOC124444127 n=1 Tax=Xenia sp. Carnegie-2017 TaxID=2897299 RepID=UPI001F04A575|nr:uncharacterized protein LOC124444127 [Xenia sp. Carnegie-2017]